jgi:3-methylcrotonyl-CoA carboxylase alpha subunit
VAERRWDFRQGEAAVPARLRYLHDGALQLAVGEGESLAEGLLSWQQAGDGAFDVQFAGQRLRAQVHVLGEQCHVFAPQGAAVLGLADPLAHAGDVHSEGGRLTAPMPGKVVSFAVKAGDKVSKGQPLAVMEAMKMEHTIAAPGDGVVAELLYAPGDQVTEGSELLRLES